VRRGDLMRLSKSSVGVTVVLLLGIAACGEDRRASVASATTSTTPGTSSSRPENTAADDPADAYLGSTTELYRRTLPDRHDFVVRISTESYATVFGMTWSAPTGSAEACLGDHAVFLGVPGDVGPWGSAWTAAPWFDEADPTQPAVLQSSMSSDFTVAATEYLVVRTDADAAEVVLLSPDGTELDRSMVANRIAALMVDPRAKGEGQTVNDLIVVVVAKDGQQSAPSPLSPTARSVSADCSPGDPPPRPLPAAGEQPANPDGAATEIRQRHALLVDLSVPSNLKPNDLLDDDTGVFDARATLDTSPFSDLASSAVFSIDELVFTRPDEAWFRYTITTTSATYADRFGIAVFNGEVWQITRATVCQDLALALAPCAPDPPTIPLPSTPEWEAEWQAWMNRANLYMVNDGCPPLSQC
jgi:hypothetical protein